jgi:SAM-dependent methyltransferase
MHPSVYAFATRALTAEQVTGKRVVEAGAYNYNGSARDAITVHDPASYLGTDVQPGPGVDVVCPAEKLPDVLGEASTDIVISTEMLEHAEDWQAAMAGIAAILKPGGLLVLTTRSPGFPYHPHPGDFWRFPVDLMEWIADGCGLEVLRCEPDPDGNSPGVFLLARKPDDGGPGTDMDVLRGLTARPALEMGWLG